MCAFYQKRKKERTSQWALNPFWMRIPIFNYNSYTILRPSIYSKKRSKLNFIQFLHLIILVQILFHPIVNLVVQVCKMILSRQNDGWKMTQPCITLSSSSVRQLNFTEKKFRISLHATGYYACLSRALKWITTVQTWVFCWKVQIS